MAPQTRGQRNIAWIEANLHVPEGRFVGEPIRLRAWQKRDIRRIYDNPAVTRTAIESFARKNGKTALGACLCLLHLVGPESRLNSQLVSTGQSREQAALVFNLAWKMVQLSPKIEPYIGAREQSKQLYVPDRGTLYQALSVESKTKFGLSPVFAIHDELGQVVGPRFPLFDAVESAMAAHDDPLSVIISTQAATDADLLSLLIDDALKGDDPHTVVSLYTSDPEANPFLVKTMRAANPAYGDFMNEKELKKQANKAKRMPSFEASYRNLNLNQRVNVVSPFVAASVWKENGGEPNMDAFEVNKVRIGLDLSARHDLTALVASCDDDDGVGHVYCEFFVPLDGLSERAHRDRVPYDLWHQQKLLTATAGASVDYETVAFRLATLCDQWDVEQVNFDRWRIDVLKAELARAGVELPLVGFGQGFKDMSPAVDDLESDLLNGTLRHGMHPILTMCAANTVTDSDPAGNRKFNKAKSTGRIDGMVALVMARARFAADAPQYVSGELVAI